MMRSITKHIIVAVIAIIIMVLSLADPGDAPGKLFMNFRHADKVMHLLMYMGFAFIVLYLYRQEISKIRERLLLALLVFSYSLLMEILQAEATTYRSFEFSDLLANFSGVILGLFFFLIIRNYRFKKSV
jgi:VanZ family protein